MARRDDELTRHFINLKRRVDDIQKELSADEIPSLIFDGSETIQVGDFVNLLVKAPNVSLIDDFEDGEIQSEYLGDTSAADVSQSNPAPFEGDYRLCMSAGGNDILSLPGDADTDLPDYPVKGDIFEAKMYYSSGSISRFYFGVQNQTNYYMVEVDTTNNRFSLTKVDSGNPTLLDEAFPPRGFFLNSWVDLVITWGDPIEIQHTDDAGNVIVELQSDDDRFTDGGIGMGEHS